MALGGGMHALDTRPPGHVMTAAQLQHAHHPVDFMDCLPQCCGLKARGHHGLHDTIQLSALIEVMAMNDRRVRNYIAWDEHSLHASLP